MSLTINKEAEIYRKFPELIKIPDEKFPEHVLIIPDGNGRWAKRLGKFPSFGHQKGFEIIKKVLYEVFELPTKTITIWGFSSDNWKRSDKEVNSLMKLFEKGIIEMIPDIIEKKIKFIHLGRRDRIPQTLLELIKKTEETTKDYDNKTLCIAIDFSGQDQEMRMFEKIRHLPKEKVLSSELITTMRDGNGDILPADLIIRTSGEQRISDLGWLSLNSEFYSIKKLLPESDSRDFVEAIIDYTKRNRRFGARLS